MYVYQLMGILPGCKRLSWEAKGLCLIRSKRYLEIASIFMHLVLTF